MKSYNLIPQERNNYCICSVLQAIFNNNKINLSQKEIADNLTPSDKGFLPHDDTIKNFLRSRGFEYFFYWYNETPFNEPDELLRDMNKYEGIIGIKSHIYLLKNFNDPILEIINPENNKVFRKDIYETLKEMKKLEGFFGLVKILQ